MESEYISTNGETMEKIQFQTNIPVTVALKFPTGKEVPSPNPAWPPQMMFTLADDRRMYLPMQVGEIINGLGLTPGEPIVVCAVEVKKGTVRTREYQVRRLDESPTAPPVPTPLSVGSGSRVATATSQPQRITPPISTVANGSGHGVLAVPKLGDSANGRSNGNAHPAGNGYSDGRNDGGNFHGANGNGRAPLPHFDPQAAQVAALRRAVDNALAIQQYAKEQNLPLGSPTFEDIRTMAAVLFIDESKLRRGF